MLIFRLAGSTAALFPALSRAATANDIKLPMQQLWTRQLASANLPRVPLLGHRDFSIHAATNNGDAGIQLTERSAERIALLQQRSKNDKLKMRLSVEGGGCSGFQYKFETTADEPKDDDRIFEKNGQFLIIDETSYEFVKGAKVDFTEDLIKRAFEVIENPNAEGGCGCGSSFAAKVSPDES